MNHDTDSLKKAQSGQAVASSDSKPAPQSIAPKTIESTVPFESHFKTFLSLVEDAHFDLQKTQDYLAEMKKQWSPEALKAAWIEAAVLFDKNESDSQTLGIIAYLVAVYEYRHLRGKRRAHATLSGTANGEGFKLSDLLVLIKTLLDLGAPINGQPVGDSTALHIATQSQDQNLIRFLIEHGASPNLFRRKTYNRYSGSAPLHTAVHFNLLDLMPLLFDQGQADVNLSSPSGSAYSPLEVSVLQGHVEMTQLLLSQGASLHSDDAMGVSALHVAAAYHYEEITLMLLLAGANHDAQNKHGETPLHETVKNGDASMAELLISHGASLFVRNHDDHTPHQFAIRIGRPEMAEYLKSCEQSLHEKAILEQVTKIVHAPQVLPSALDESLEKLSGPLERHRGRRSL